MFRWLKKWVVVAERAEEERREGKEHATKELRRKIEAEARIIVNARTPERMLEACPDEVPYGIRLQRTEKAAWIVPKCTYLRTRQQVSYVGGSSGGSFRVAEGVNSRTGSVRGERIEDRYYEELDCGTVVLTDRHLYFLGNATEQFRVRLDQLVSARGWANAFTFQRDGVSARPEMFLSPNAWQLSAAMDVLDDPETAAVRLFGEEEKDEDCASPESAATALTEADPLDAVLDDDRKS